MLKTAKETVSLVSRLLIVVVEQKPVSRQAGRRVAGGRFFAQECQAAVGTAVAGHVLALKPTKVDQPLRELTTQGCQGATPTVGHA